MTKKYPEFQNSDVQEDKPYKLTSDYLQPANFFDSLLLFGLPFDHLRGVPTGRSFILTPQGIFTLPLQFTNVKEK